MMGIWILVSLIFISSLPIFAAFIWFRIIRFPLTIRWFLGSLATGAAGLLLAGFLQGLFPPLTGIDMGTLLFKLFIQFALTEEFGRLIFIYLFLRIYRRFLNPSPDQFSDTTLPSGPATGFLAGLGFAVIETAVYGAADPGSAFLRAFVVAPLHGACGCRVGLTAASLSRSPFRAFMFFLYAVGIHGMYNFMVINPALPPFFPIILVFAALLSSIRIIRRERRSPP
jgi:RsiW-degrading membrane proteinase PrsW (M82 family)